MDKNNDRIDLENFLQNLVDDVETERFLATWNQNITAIFEHDEAVVRCYLFMRKYGIPQQRARTYGGKTYEMKEFLNIIISFFLQSESYSVCARLKKFKPLPAWMLKPRYQAFASQLEEFYSDATIVMSQKEGFAMIQNILQHASEFFDLDRPYNWVLIWDKIIEHQRQLESLDVGALNVLEAIKDETIQFAHREKSLYDIGIREKRFFYRVLE